jgi:hypothetical protein
MSILQDLLAKGYFARELPPPFNSDSFSVYADSVGHSWKVGKWSSCVGHNLARPGGLRRPLRIPNPISYFALAKILAGNWPLLKQHTWKERLSASRPHLMKNSPRAIVPRYRFSELPRLRALRRRGSRYLLKTDISQFYPTLYTHAVPWALHTKAQCKTLLATKGRGGSLLGNKIDKALQCMNEGQTHGIPIGPDASLLVAEVLLAAVDAELIRRCPGMIRGFRNIDDYELSFGDLGEGETVLTELQGILADYELRLNPRKTKLEDLPRGFEDSWGIDLVRFVIRDAGSPVGQRNDLIAFFSRTAEIALQRPEDPVIRYALAKVQKSRISSIGWHTFQNCVLGAANADASAIAVALGTLFQVSVLGGFTIAKSPLAETLDNIIDRHARRGEGSEVAWAIWGAMALSISLSQRSAQSMSQMEDDIVALLALDADSRGLFPMNTIDKTLWSSLITQPNALRQEHWLLAYEANQQNWITTPAVTADPEFLDMSKSNVSFYDRSRNIPQFPTAAKGIPGGSLTNYYA